MAEEIFDIKCGDFEGHDLLPYGMLTCAEDIITFK
jgi:hypothetical protein